MSDTSNLLLSVTVGDGKYTVKQEASGRLIALRYGEPWRDCCGDGLIYTLAAEVEKLKCALIADERADPPNVEIPATAEPNGSAPRRSFTQQEIVSEAARWLGTNYSTCKKEHPDKFYERLGLLVDFVTDIVPNTRTELVRDVCHECGGTGGMDSGGVTPWGSAITLPCPSCSPNPNCDCERCALTSELSD